jgi:hypothetical protein
VKDRGTGRRHGRVVCDPLNAVPAADTTPMLVPAIPATKLCNGCGEYVLRVEFAAHAKGHAPTALQQIAEWCRTGQEPAALPTPEQFNGAAAADSAQQVTATKSQRSPLPAGLGGPALPSAAPTPPPSAATEESKTMATKLKLKPLNDLTDAEVKAARESWGSDYATAKGLGCSVYLLKKREKAIEERGRVQPGVETPPEAPPPGQHPREDHHGDGPCDACAPAPVSDIEQMLAERLAMHEAAIEKLRGHEREAVRIRAALDAMKAA